MVSPIENLSDDVMREIFEYCDPRSCMQLGRTCSEFRRSTAVFVAKTYECPGAITIDNPLSGMEWAMAVILACAMDKVPIASVVVMGTMCVRCTTAVCSCPQRQRAFVELLRRLHDVPSVEVLCMAGVLCNLDMDVNPRVTKLTLSKCVGSLSLHKFEWLRTLELQEVRSPDYHARLQETLDNYRRGIGPRLYGDPSPDMEDCAPAGLLAQVHTAPPSLKVLKFQTASDGYDRSGRYETDTGCVLSKRDAAMLRGLEKLTVRAKYFKTACPLPNLKELDLELDCPDAGDVLPICSSPWLETLSVHGIWGVQLLRQPSDVFLNLRCLKVRDVSLCDIWPVASLTRLSDLDVEFGKLGRFRENEDQSALLDVCTRLTRLQCLRLCAVYGGDRLVLWDEICMAIARMPELDGVALDGMSQDACTKLHNYMDRYRDCEVTWFQRQK